MAILKRLALSLLVAAGSTPLAFAVSEDTTKKEQSGPDEVTTVTPEASVQVTEQDRSVHTTYESFNETSANKPEISTAAFNAQSLYTLPFFSPALDLTPATREVAFATHQLAYVKADDNVMLLALQDPLTGTYVITKYEFTEHGLKPVKSETYTGTVVGGESFCIRRGPGARKGAGKGYERMSRVFRAQAKPTDMLLVTVPVLYQSNAPIWIQVTSSDVLQRVLSIFAHDLHKAAIDPQSRAPELRPVCWITIKDKTSLINDPFLASIETTQWQTLFNLFTMTTLRDSKVRSYVADAKEALADTIEQAKKSKVDLNPSLAEGLYEDIKESYHGFNLKRFFRKIASDFADPGPALKIVGGLAFCGLIAWGVTKAWKWTTASEVLDAHLGASEKARKKRVEKRENALAGKPTTPAMIQAHAVLDILEKRYLESLADRYQPTYLTAIKEGKTVKVEKANNSELWTLTASAVD